MFVYLKQILKTADSEICNAAEEKEVDPQNFETQTESPEQEKVTEESASVEEKSDATAILVPSEGHIEEKENAINESNVVPQSTTESVIEPEEKISQGVETNEESSDMVIAGEVCSPCTIAQSTCFVFSKTKLVSEYPLQYRTA